MARAALREIVGLLGTEVPADLGFESQARSDDQSIPDLVGFDEDRRRVLIIEAKFWAGLTDNQPVTYLRQLPGDAPGILLFVAPKKRMETLWMELLRRCAEAGIPADTPGGAPERAGRPRAQPLRRELAPLAGPPPPTFLRCRRPTIRGGHCAARGTLRPDRRGAFLPLRSEELSGLEVPRRIVQYHGLVDDVVEKLRSAPRLSTARRRSTAGFAWYGCALDFEGVRDAFLVVTFNANSWLECGGTPLWLDIYGDGWKMPPAPMRRLLAPFASATPPRLIEFADRLSVPLHPPTDEERTEVVARLVARGMEVVATL